MTLIYEPYTKIERPAAAVNRKLGKFCLPTGAIEPLGELAKR